MRSESRLKFKEKYIPNDSSLSKILMKLPDIICRSKTLTRKYRTKLSFKITPLF